MTRLAAILITGLIIGIGVVEHYFAINDIRRRLGFTTDYRNRFINLVDKVARDQQLDLDNYYILIEESNRIQNELKNEGLAFYQDPYTGIQTNNYALFLNVFSEMRSFLSEPYLFKDRFQQITTLCDEALTRHIGNLKTIINEEYPKLKNPFYCFSNGIRFILDIPVRLLESIGIINTSLGNRIMKSKVHIAISHVITLLGLIASLITIIDGWGHFAHIIQSIF